APVEAQRDGVDEREDDERDEQQGGRAKEEQRRPAEPTSSPLLGGGCLSGHRGWPAFRRHRSLLLRLIRGRREIRGEGRPLPSDDGLLVLPGSRRLLLELLEDRSHVLSAQRGLKDGTEIGPRQ